jgi:hypothetical protein
MLEMSKDLDLNDSNQDGDGWKTKICMQHSKDCRKAYLGYKR